jgi:hypothetical protein
VEKKSKHRVLIGTPTYDYNMAVDYTRSLMAASIWCTWHDIDIRAKFVGGLCFIDLARNEIVKQFMATDCTDLFFIDADVGFDYKAIPRFLEHPEFIVAGLVPKKWATHDSDKPPFHDNALTGKMENGLLESLEAPTAFMRIKREVFEILDAAYPWYKDVNTMDRGIPYFQNGFVKDPETEKVSFMGEDIYFCRQWCRLGEKVWIDPDVNFSHRGSNSWTGNHMEHCFEVGKLTKLESPEHSAAA